jgi:WD40 repeat protein
MDTGPERNDSPELARGDAGPHQVDARHAQGVQVGDHATQINYFYSRGVASPPHITHQAEIEAPYMGLRAFREQDAALFFGREGAVTRVLELISSRLDGPGNLVVISGASGAGKSSLLHAGVLPRLRGSGLPSRPEAASWPCLAFSPASEPLGELAIQVARLTGATSAAVHRDLADDPSSFALTVREATGEESAGRRLLLVVDQCEQLFTQCTEEDRYAFLTAVHAATTAGHGADRLPRAAAVLVIRADFETRLAEYRPHEYPLLAPAVQDRFLLTSMNERELRMAITQPAAAAGSAADENLVQVLLEEVRTRPPSGGPAVRAGVLPLLSHALHQAWRQRTGPTLTLADYERTGGIREAVAVSAQAVYDRLSPTRQDVARQVFTRLTATSDDGIDTAIAVTRAELYAGKDPGQVADVDAVLETFAAQRLLTLASDTAEISHESLLTAWPLLRDTWLAGTHEDRVVRTRLGAAAREWERTGHDRSYLYSGSRLEQAEHVRARMATDLRHAPLTTAEHEFLRAGRRARRNAGRRRRAVMASLAAITLLAVGSAGAAADYAVNARQQHAMALSRQLAAESINLDSTDPFEARQLAVAAWHVNETGQAQAAMATLLTEQRQSGEMYADPKAVGGVAIRPDGKLLASADDDGTVRLWNPLTGQPVGAPINADPGTFGRVLKVAFSPNGKLLASADIDGTVRLWDPATRQIAGPVIHAGPWQDSALDVTFSPDGELATADDDGTVQLWNPVTGAPAGPPITIPAPPGQTHAVLVNRLAFSPDGRLLATADDDGTIRLWNPVTGKPVGPPLNIGTGDSANDVAFSPDGTLLASSGDGTVRLWNPVTGKPVGHVMQAGGGEVAAVAFSPDGTLLASVGSTSTLQLWNPATGRPVGTAGAGAGNDVAFSPDGQIVATADADGTVRLWNPVTSQPIGAPILAVPTRSFVWGVAFSPDGKLLATADDGGRVRLWNAVTGSPVRRPIQADSGPAANVQGVLFSPGGTVLASVELGGGIVRMWDSVSGRPVGGPIQTGNMAASSSGLAFSPDGTLLATGEGNGSVTFWSTVTGRPASHPIRVAGGNTGAIYLAFSPGGALLATANGDGTIQFWNPATGKPADHPIRAAGGGVIGLAFSADGKVLAAAATDGTVRRFNAATGQPVGTVISVPGPSGGPETNPAFSPDGTLLAAAATDGTVQLFNAATGQPIGVPLQATSPRDLVMGVAFSPDGRVLATADGDGTVKLWEVADYTDPYQALCAEVGPPSEATWQQNAQGESEPTGICAGPR